MHLRVPTLGELMKARWPASRNVAVAGKDRAAVMMGGHSPTSAGIGTARALSPTLPARRARWRSPQVECRDRGARSRTAREPLEPPPILPGQGARRSPIEGGGKPVGAGTLRARRRRRRGIPRLARVRRRRRWRSPPALVEEMQARPAARRPDLARDQPVGDRLCRPQLRHRRARKCASSCSRSTASSAISSRCSTPRHRLCGRADRRPWRQRHSRARCGSHGVADAARVDPALTAAAWARRIGQPSSASPGRSCSASSSATSSSTERFAGADRERALDAAVAAYRAHPQVEAVFTARPDRSDARYRRRRRTNGR